jgi:hypothetical protein
MDYLPFLPRMDVHVLTFLDSLSAETLVMILVVTFCSGLVFGLMISLQLSPPHTEQHEKEDEDEDSDDEDSDDEDVESEDEDEYGGRSLSVTPFNRRTLASAGADKLLKVGMIHAAMHLRTTSPDQALDLGRMLFQLQSSALRGKGRIPTLRSFYPRMVRRPDGLLILDALVKHPHLVYVAVGPLLQRK